MNEQLTPEQFMNGVESLIREVYKNHQSKLTWQEAEGNLTITEQPNNPLKIDYLRQASFQLYDAADAGSIDIFWGYSRRILFNELENHAFLDDKNLIHSEPLESYINLPAFQKTEESFMSFLIDPPIHRLDIDLEYALQDGVVSNVPTNMLREHEQIYVGLSPFDGVKKALEQINANYDHL